MSFPALFPRAFTRSRRLLSSNITILSTRHITTTSPAKPPPFPSIPTCPPASCTCAPMPSFPPGFEVDHDKPLNGTVASYAEQVLICTGKDDWVSNITDENGGENLAAGIKGLVGRGGSFVDPYHNILVTNASFPSSSSPSDQATTSAYLLPSFKYIPSIPRTPEGVQALVKGLLLPQNLHPIHDSLSPKHKARVFRDETQARGLGEVRSMGGKEVLVLICGHGGRDVRCGILGTLLRNEFERSLQKLLPRKSEDEGVVAGSPGELDSGIERERDGDIGARVGLISHIGGHKFAGNVIIYLPPDSKMADGTTSPLAGTGIWYGRVEPRHVEGIVRETVLGGRVIEDLFRGGVRKGGEALRI